MRGILRFNFMRFDFLTKEQLLFYTLQCGSTKQQGGGWNMRLAQTREEGQRWEDWLESSLLFVNPPI